jgi:hypothetical protein
MIVKMDKFRHEKQCSRFTGQNQSFGLAGVRYEELGAFFALGDCPAIP